jgi:CD63 antigen
MVYGCGNKTVKYLVFFFNFLVFVIGIAVLALSLTVIFSNDAQKYFQGILDKNNTDVNLNQMYIPLYVLAAVGGLLLLTGFLGCCGAWMENTCLLSLFFTIILILFVAELACGIAVLVNKDGFKNTVFEGIKKEMKRYNSDLPPDQKHAIDQMQESLQCCGCDGPGDFFGTIPPASCKSYTEGCCNKIWNKLESQLGIVGGVAIGILVIELLAMIFSCILCQAFRRGDYQYA